MVSRPRFSAMVAISVAALTIAAPAAAWQTSFFSHEDERYLLAQQRQGGAALVPPGDHAEKLPLVVLLHGTNETGELHMWFGGKQRDLRPMVRRVIDQEKVRPFIFAAPSQTRHAVAPRALWAGFNLSTFVEDTVRAIGAAVDVDRGRVIVVGHSGAGCNPRGGLVAASALGKVQPMAVAAIDTCLDGEMGAALNRRPSNIPLSVWWQSAVWPRSPDSFWKRLTHAKPAERSDMINEVKLSGPTAHDDILPLALEQVLLQLLPPQRIEAS